jgi:hypothetical protein
LYGNRLINVHGSIRKDAAHDLDFHLCAPALSDKIPGRNSQPFLMRASKNEPLCGYQKKVV